MLGKPLLMLLLMPGLRPPDVGYNLMEQGWADNEAWEELEKYAVTNNDLRNLGDKCIGTGICCNLKQSICTAEASCNSNNYDSNCSQSGTQENCKLTTDGSISAVSKVQGSGDYVLNNSFWDWYTTRPASICPIGVCSMRSQSGIDMTPCLTVTGQGIVTLHTSLVGCPIGTGDVDVYCSYDWPDSATTGQSGDWMDGNDFTVTIIAAAVCSGVTFTQITPSDLTYTMGDTGGANQVVLTHDLTTYITQSSVSPCYLQSCKATQRTADVSCTDANNSGDSTWISVAQSLSGTTTTLTLTINTSTRRWSDASIMLCIMCETNDAIPVNVYSDKFLIKVKADCLTSFTTNTFTNPTVAYNNSPSTAVASSSWTNLFTNTDLALCPMVTCLLKKSSCSGSLSGTSNLSIGASNPWVITMNINVVASYTESAAIQCTAGLSGENTITLCKDFTVTQTAIDCTGMLTIASAPTDQILTFNSASPSTTLLNADTFFTNSNTVDCPVTACSLLASGCGSAFTISELTMAVTTPWTITATRNTPAGYVQSACIQCTNDNHGQTFDTTSSGTYIVTQTKVDCTSTMTHLSTATLSHTWNYNTVGAYTDSMASDYFANSDTTYCKMTACTIKSSGCSSAYSGSEVIISSAWPFALTSTRSTKIGYSVSICVQCNNDQHGHTYQTISTNLMITLNHICMISMTAGSSVPAKPTKAYSSSTTTEVVLTDTRTIYTEAQPTDCATHSCQLLSSSCTALQASSRLSIGSSPTYAITMQKNVVAGYTETVCLKCSNGYDFQTLAYTVTQTALSCTSVLTPNSAADQTQSYSNSPTTWSVGDWTTYFTNSNTVDCPVTSCTLYSDSGCSTAYTGTNVIISSVSPFAITAQKNISAGWTSQFCVSCTNGAQKITQTGFDLTQTADISLTSLGAEGTTPSNSTQDPTPAIEGKPSFEDSFQSSIFVKVTRTLFGTLKEDKFFTFTSPKVVDPSNQPIKISFSGLEQVNYTHVEQNMDNSFSLKVDRSGISADQARFHRLSIKVENNKGEEVINQLMTVIVGFEQEEAMVLPIPTDDSKTIEVTNSTDTDTENGTDTDVNLGSSQEIGRQGEIEVTETDKEDQKIMLWEGWKSKWESTNSSQNVQNKDEKDVPDPTVIIKPVSMQGGLTIEFNQEMIVPKLINYNFYNYAFRFHFYSDIEGTRTRGRVVQKQNTSIPMNFTIPSRRLENQEHELNPYDFNITVEKHSGLQIEFQLHFRKPNLISMGNKNDQIMVEFLDPDTFKSALTFRSIDASSFKKGRTNVVIPVQPFIDKDKEIIINDITESGEDIFNFVSHGNFALQLVLGGSMQKLFGMIRAMQLIVLSFLPNVQAPAHTKVFMRGCMTIAQLDIADGQQLYEEWFDFEETGPLNSNFELLDYGDKNFMMNSGSFFILFVGIFAFTLLLFLVNFFMKQCAHKRKARKIGIWAYRSSYTSDMKSGFIKLFVESYLDICMAALLQAHAYHESYSEGKLSRLFSSREERMNSSFAIITTAFIIGVPLWVYSSLMKKLNGTLSKEQEKYLKILYKENKLKTKVHQLYSFFFLIRRTLTVVLLVMVNKIPAIQLTQLCIISFLNLAYLVGWYPLKKKQENRMEVFNEFCVYLFSLTLRTMLDIANQETGKEILGWQIIGIVSFNVMINLSSVIYQSIFSFYKEVAQVRMKMKVQKIFKHRLDNRVTLSKMYQGEFTEFITQIKAEKSILALREWHTERKWLVKNKIKFFEFEEEKFYQLFMEKLQLFNQAEEIKITKAISLAALIRAEQIMKTDNSRVCRRYKTVDIFVEKLDVDMEPKTPKTLSTAVKKLFSPKQSKKFKSAPSVQIHNLTEIIEEPDQENIVEMDYLKVKIEKQVRAEFKNSNLLYGFQDRAHIDVKGVQKINKNLLVIQEGLNEMSEGENKSKLTQIVHQEKSQYMESVESASVRESFAKSLSQRRDVSFLIESSGSSSENDYVKEILDCFDMTGTAAQKRFQDGEHPRLMSNTGSNDFLQAALQALIHQELIVELSVREPVETNKLHKLMNWVVLEAYQDTPSFMKQKQVSVDVTNFQKALSYYFKPELPQDASEAIQVLLDLLQEELGQKKDKKGIQMLKRLFDTTVKQKVVCSAGHTMNIYQFSIKKYKLEHSQFVHEHIKELFRSEDVDIVCSYCSKQSTLNEVMFESPRVIESKGVKKTEIIQLSELMLFRLPVLEQGPQMSDLPSSIDLERFMDKTVLRHTQVSTTYDLTGLINCTGDSLDNSMYESFFLQNGTQSSWIKYTKDKKEELQDWQPSQVKRPQMLLYTRRKHNTMSHIKLVEKNQK